MEVIARCKIVASDRSQSYQQTEYWKIREAEDQGGRGSSYTLLEKRRQSGCPSACAVEEFSDQVGRLHTLASRVIPVAIRQLLVMPVPGD
jgi:hypothetical protein